MRSLSSILRNWKSQFIIQTDDRLSTTFINHWLRAFKGAKRRTSDATRRTKDRKWKHFNFFHISSLSWKLTLISCIVAKRFFSSRVAFVSGWLCGEELNMVSTHFYRQIPKETEDFNVSIDRIFSFFVCFRKPSAAPDRYFLSDNPGVFRVHFNRKTLEICVIYSGRLRINFEFFVNDSRNLVSREPW